MPLAEAEKIATRKPFTDHAVLVQKGNPAALVVLREDLGQLAGDARLVELALDAACTPENPAVPLAKLKMALHSLLRKPFEQAVLQRIRENTLPSTVGCKLVNNRPQLFLRRMPPAEPEVQLAEGLLRVLEDQKQRGGGGYPVALPRLIQLTAPQADPKLVPPHSAARRFGQGPW